MASQFRKDAFSKTVVLSSLGEKKLYSAWSQCRLILNCVGGDLRMILKEHFFFATLKSS